MSASLTKTSGSRRREASWILPGVLAASTAVAMAFVAGKVRVPEGEGMRIGPVRPEKGGTPALVVTRMEWLPVAGPVRERLRLFDPTPLFMPGGVETGFSQGAGGDVARSGGGVTEAEDPVLVFPELSPAGGMVRGSAPDSPGAAAEFAASSRWFEGLARSGVDGAAGAGEHFAAPRLDVYARGASAKLASLALPAVLDSLGTAWQPVELSVLINAGGVIASPVVTSGSGVDEIDERVRAVVKQDLLPRLRLRPGAYRLVVGP